MHEKGRKNSKGHSGLVHLIPPSRSADRRARQTRGNGDGKPTEEDWCPAGHMVSLRKAEGPLEMLPACRRVPVDIGGYLLVDKTGNASGPSTQEHGRLNARGSYNRNGMRERAQRKARRRRAVPRQRPNANRSRPPGGPFAEDLERSTRPARGRLRSASRAPWSSLGRGTPRSFSCTHP